MTSKQTTLQEQDSAKSPVLYMAIEMGERNWKLLFSSGEAKRNGQLRTYQRTIEGNDWEALEEMIKLSKKRLKLDEEVQVVSCYEAGQDGFYPHRQMLSRGIDNRVVDSASIEVNRRPSSGQDGQARCAQVAGDVGALGGPWRALACGVW